MEKNKRKTMDELRKSFVSDSDSRKRISYLFDEGTFVEIGSYVKEFTTEFDDCDGNEFEGVITGYGAIDGRLVFAYVQDFTKMKGALSEAHARKICKLYELAINAGAPVVGVFDSAGAKVLEGTAAIAGYGSIMKMVSKASGIIPQIAVIAGICSGTSAAIASMYDFIIGVNSTGKFYVNPPFVVKELSKDKTFGTIEKAEKSGLVNVSFETDAEALSFARMLVNYLPSNNATGTVYAFTNDSPNRETPDIEAIVSSGAYDMKSVLQSISDNGVFFELSSKYAGEMLTGFIQFNSIIVGTVASQPSVNGGKITPAAALKAAKFVSVCDSFNIPLLTLVDTEGFEISAENEEAPYATAIAKLASAYAVSNNAKVTAVLGKAYGTSFALMGSKTLGADVAFALPTAKISIMPPEAAIEFVYANKIKISGAPEKAKGECTDEWNNVYSSPVSAARKGEIDDIIKCSELRMRVTSAFEMLSEKCIKEPTKKHGNLPL